MPGKRQLTPQQAEELQNIINFIETSTMIPLSIKAHLKQLATDNFYAKLDNQKPSLQRSVEQPFEPDYAIGKKQQVTKPAQSLTPRNTFPSTTTIMLH